MADPEPPPAQHDNDETVPVFRRRKKLGVKTSSKSVLDTPVSNIPAEDADIGKDAGASDVIKKKKKKKSQKGKQSRPISSGLSFDDDEVGDTEVFKIDKSKASAGAKFNKSAKAKKKSGTNSKSTVAVSSGGSYSAKDLAELVKSNTMIKKPPPPPSTMDVGPQGETDMSDPNQQAAAAFLSDMMQGTGTGTGTAGSVGVEAEIPDRDAIIEAKRKREIARKEAEYIPLDDHDNVRRLPVDDDGDDGDDVVWGTGSDKSKKYISLADSQPGRRRISTAHMASVVQSVDDEEPDHPMNRVRPAVIQKKKTQRSMPKSVQDPGQDVNAEVVMDDLLRGLNNTLISLNEVLTSDKTHLNRIEVDIETSKESIGPIQVELDEATQRYKMYEEMKCYVRDMLACLEVKGPEIEECQNQLHRLWLERANTLSSRAKQDLSDQYELVADTGQPQPKFDAYGNNIAFQLVAARDSRVADRKRRRMSRQLNRSRQEKEASEIEGVSTDEDEEVDAIDAYNNERNRILVQSQQIFLDVVDEFCNAKLIAHRFEYWKRTYPDTYKEGKVGQALGKILPQLVKLQVLDWNPLHVNCPNFEDMDWFKDLMMYGVTDESDDSDDMLVPDLVESVLLEKLAGILEFIWNPLSRGQSTRALQTFLYLLEDYPTVSPEREATQNIYGIIASRLQALVDERIAYPLVPLYSRQGSKALLVDSLLSQDMKILRAILLWEGHISASVTQGLVFKFLCQRMLSYLSTAPFGEALVVLNESIVNALPSNWFVGSSAATAAVKLAIEPYLNHLKRLSEYTNSNSPDLSERVFRILNQFMS